MKQGTITHKRRNIDIDIDVIRARKGNDKLCRRGQKIFCSPVVGGVGLTASCGLPRSRARGEQPTVSQKKLDEDIKGVGIGLTKIHLGR